MSKPRIFCFSDVIFGGLGMAFAMAEDGTILGSNICSDESLVPKYMGALEGSTSLRHSVYKEHYPDGYEMEFVPAKNAHEHTAFMAANQKRLEKGGPHPF